MRYFALLFRTLGLIGFLALRSGLVLAQAQNNTWMFGNRAGLRFEGSSVSAFTSSQMVSVEGCASVSDPVSGKILFYTDGLRIWDSTNTVMPNGSGLLSGNNTSSTQGVIIVPFPAKPGRYVVFTVDETTNGAANGFRYNVVDMSLNGGMGDVVPDQKNILIQTNTTERLAYAPIADGSGYWVMIHERGNAVFKAFKLTANGVDFNPVVSTIGSVHNTVPQPLGDATQGYMKFNHRFDRVAVAIYVSKKVEVFTFNNCTGVVSSPAVIPFIDNPYGLEFSPDNSKLYVSVYVNQTLTGYIYQVNLLSPIPSGSLVRVGTSSSENPQCVGALQLAPDKKIYISINSEKWISAITLPNSSGLA